MLPALRSCCRSKTTSSYFFMKLWLGYIIIYAARLVLMLILKMPRESTREQHHSWQVMLNELRSGVRACHMSWKKEKKEERPQCKQEGNYFVGTLEQICCSSCTQAWLLEGSAEYNYASKNILSFRPTSSVFSRKCGSNAESQRVSIHFTREQLLEHLSTQNSIVFYLTENGFKKNKTDCLVIIITLCCIITWRKSN